MKMTLAIILVCLCFCTVSCIKSEPDNENVSDISGDLYVTEVNIKNDAGKDLIMSFEEIERREEVSIVRVEYVEGASVPSIMFIVKGACNIAKIRQKNYFVLINEWTDVNDDRIYMFAFTDSKDANQQVFQSEDCTKQIDDEAFLSVKDYDLLWAASK